MSEEKPKINVEMLTERHILPVMQPYLKTSPDRVEVDVCRECGAVVLDPMCHILWHVKLEKAL